MSDEPFIDLREWESNVPLEKMIWDGVRKIRLCGMIHDHRKHGHAFLCTIVHS